MSNVSPRILLVSGSFAPSLAIGGRRAEKMADYLAGHGWEVTVLTMEPHHMPPIDEKLPVGTSYQLIRTAVLSPRTFLRGKNTSSSNKPIQAVSGQSGAKVTLNAKQRLRKIAGRVLAQWEMPDEWIGWLPFALRAVRGRQFDVVLSTAPPFSGHVLAHKIAMSINAKLVLDYRDPWTELQAGAREHKHRKLEDACLHDAALVIGVTPTVCAWLAKRTKQNIALITNGFVETAAKQPPRSPLELVYAGSLAYGRDLQPILQAMAQLRSENADLLPRLTYAGAFGALLLQQAQVLGLTDQVKDLGQIASAQALALLAGRIAVVIVSSGFDYAYPGKIFEIIGQQVPMLLLAPGDCAATQLVEKHRLGWWRTPQDIEGICQDLRQMAQGHVPEPIDLQLLHVDTVMQQLDLALRATLSP